MTLKPKPKAQPTSVLARFWREFLFATSFEYHIPATLDDCTEALENHLSPIYLQSLSTTSADFSLNSDGMVYAIGRLDYDADSKRTFIHGEVVFNAKRYVPWFSVALVFLLLTAWLASQSATLGALILVAALPCGLWWWLVWQARNALRQALHEAVGRIPCWTDMIAGFHEPDKQKVSITDAYEPETQTQSRAR